MRDVNEVVFTKIDTEFWGHLLSSLHLLKVYMDVVYAVFTKIIT